MRNRRPTIFVSRSGCYLLLLLVLTSSAGCLNSSPPVASVHCPRPSESQATDYASLGDRPATRWVGRLIGYCWPEELEEVRDAAPPDDAR